MRILWFTNTPSNASEEFNFKSFRGGWISSLEKLIRDTKKYQLAVCFYYEGDTFKKLTKEGVVYFGVPLKPGNSFNRIKTRHRALLIDENSNILDKVIDDFRPDLIHVFGTESGYGKSLMQRTEKILFNIQGLMNPIADSYFPPGFNKFKILAKSNIVSVLRGLSYFHDYRYVRKRARREKIVMRHYKYYIGRTEWDRNYVKLVNPDAQYFHCEEMLRKDFFENEWKQPTELNGDNEIVIGTTIFASPYKGLDLIYKVMNLMNNNNIKWKIFGINEENVLNKIFKKGFIDEKMIQNIQFYGPINAEELIKQLLNCHFFVHPSYIDNSSNSVCEAMMLGMPVLASFVGGIKTLVNHGETGFLFNPYDKYDLAGLLVNLIDNYEKAKSAGSKARQTALKRHSPETIQSDLEQIYNCIYFDTPFNE